ncbi:NtaA/DmoA family FMN-dependent monooxygenase [Microbispora siamensis]
MTDRRLLLAIDLDGDGAHPAAWRHSGHPPAHTLTAAALRRVVAEAEAAGFALATFADAPLPTSPAPDSAGRLEAGARAAFAALLTSGIGLAPTLHTTTTEPFHLATQLVSLDHASRGRAAWVVGAADGDDALATIGAQALAGEDARREAADVVEVARLLWAPDAIAESGEETSWARPGAICEVERDTDLVRLRARATVPAGAQGRPVLFQAGDSDGGRELAARHADVVFSANTDYDKAVAYAADLRARLARYGRSPDSLRILPGASVILDDTPEEARERAEWVRAEQLSPPRTIAFLEQYWDTDLSGYDPHGPLPDIEPSQAELDPSRGTLPIERRTGKLATIARWREQAAAENLSILQLVRRVTPRERAFVGTPSQVADEWVRYVRTRAVDGFNISPHLLPSSLEDIVNKLVPELQERGVYRTEYTGTTLREYLDLPAPS